MTDPAIKPQSFKSKYPLDKRRSESARVREKYPLRIPMIVEPRNGLHLTDVKYLAPRELEVGEFMYVIRKKMRLPPENALYFFTSRNQIPAPSTTLQQLYDTAADEDGFVYLTVSSEAAFG